MGSDSRQDKPPKLKLRDWIWIGLAVAIFAGVFLVIFIYDFI